MLEGTGKEHVSKESNGFGLRKSVPDNVHLL